ncbi:MAG: autotransporter domain-containing protein [Rhizobiaceae bacterium]|nr:autotransporter domain-containing protein [Rhizobiaceae bacterium]
MRKRRQIRCVGCSLLLVAAAGTAHAQDATWLANPADRDFNNPLNWSGGVVPTGTAVFGGADVVRAVLTNIQLGGIRLLPGAGRNVLNVSTSSFTLDGAGIAIDGGSLHVTNTGLLTFKNHATSGSARISNLPATSPFFTTILSFQDDSNAGTSTIRNDAIMSFLGRSSADHASITNGASAALRFGEESTLGSASIDNAGGLVFADDSTAGKGSILNRRGGLLVFTEDASAGSATIVNSSAGMPGSPFAGLLFADGSTAGKATIITKNGGLTMLSMSADGGTAAFETDATSTVDFSTSLGQLADGVVHVGSLSGAGTYIIGFDQTLMVGGNNRSTEVSGTIRDDPYTGKFGGAITKTGTGTLTLSGTNTYTGFTTVAGGKLIVNGSIANSIATLVDEGATIGGRGIVGSLDVDAGGILAPGETVGTLTVDGDLVMQDGALFDVDISTTSDKVAVIAATTLFGSGSATLGGTVGARYGTDGWLQKRYTILTATGGIDDAFAGVVSSAPGILPTLSYDAGNVYLNNAVVLSSLPGLTGNQSPIATTIDRYFATSGTVPLALATLDANGLTRVSGEVSTAAMGAGFDASGQFLGVIAQQGTAGGTGGAPLGYASDGAMLAYATDAARNARRGGRLVSSGGALATSGSHNIDTVDQAFASRWTLWGAAYGGSERVGGDASVGSAAFSATTWGMASGVARSFDGGTLGVALGGAGTSFGLAGNLGSGSASSFNAGLHGSVDLSSAAYLSGALGWGYHATRTTRTVPGAMLSGRFGAQTLSGRAEAGYRLDLGGISLTPYGAAEATLYRLPAYTETSAGGSPVALAYSSQSQTSLRTELGAKAALELGSVTLTGRAAWVWNAQNARAVTAGFAALPGTSFAVNGAAPARHAALVDLGVQAALTDSVFARLNVTGEFSQNVSSYGGQAKIGFRW